MTPLVPALAGALIVAGFLGMALGLRRTPSKPTAARRQGALARRGHQVSPRTQRLLLAGVIAGVVIAALTGWAIAVVLVPAAVVGLPMLLATPASAARIDKLEAMEEWTRALSGVLTAGLGLEQALAATLRSTPEAIRPEVATLVARLRARWETDKALRAFADDLDDATGDLVASNLILAARRRGTGVASVLEALSESVAADVRARRAIEADRAGPRAVARYTTLITAVVLSVLALTGSFLEPFQSPLGQVILVALLGVYVAALIWMRRMTIGEPLPRFIGAAARSEVIA